MLIARIGLKSDKIIIFTTILCGGMTRTYTSMTSTRCRNRPRLKIKWVLFVPIQRHWTTASSSRQTINSCLVKPDPQSGGSALCMNENFSLKKKAGGRLQGSNEDGEGDTVRCFCRQSGGQWVHWELNTSSSDMQTGWMERRGRERHQMWRGSDCLATTEPDPSNF